MRSKIGDSNFTERNSRRSADGVFGVECARLGSDLKSAADENSRRTGCGVVLGDQIPMQTKNPEKFDKFDVIATHFNVIKTTR